MKTLLVLACLLLASCWTLEESVFIPSQVLPLDSYQVLEPEPTPAPTVIQNMPAIPVSEEYRANNTIRRP